MAEKILYTKYSNDRAEEFRIMTQIVERNDGAKVARKSAACEKSAPHIQKMLESEKRLGESFSGTRFRASRILSSTEKSVDFEYVTGKSFDKILDGYLKNKDLQGFKSAVDDFFSELDKLSVAAFHESEATRAVFGEKAFEEGEKSIPCGNIDLIFQNVIVSDDGAWNVIDYEWIFDFAVPVRYLKWRSLYNFAIFSSFVRSLGLDLLSMFGLTAADEVHFKKIEVNGFQKSLDSGRHLGYVVPTVRKPLLNPYVLEQQDCIDVFYDTGNGFSEAEKDVFYQFPVTVHYRDNLRALRIAPSAHHCIVSGVSIKADENALAFTTNAYMQKNGSYFFNTSDSQICADLQNESARQVTFDMKVFALDEMSFATIEEQSKTIENLRSIAENFRRHLEQQIQQADLAIQAKQQEINSIYASRSWKITKPFRCVGKILRKLRSLCG